MKLESLSPRTPASLAYSIRKHTHGSDSALVKKREGEVLRWYLDSLGKKTGGVGHLWRKGDPESIDQKVSAEWLEKDLAGARKAAQKQFNQLPFQTQDLYDVLVSVNFQFGNDFDTDFPATWEMLKNGYYSKAADALQATKWNQQTPVRVKDFQNAIRDAAMLYKQYRDLGL